MANEKHIKPCLERSEGECRKRLATGRTTYTYHNAGQTLGDDLQRHSNDLENRRVAQHAAIVAHNEQNRVDRPANDKERKQLAVQTADLLLLLAQ